MIFLPFTSYWVTQFYKMNAIVNDFTAALGNTAAGSKDMEVVWHTTEQLISTASLNHLIHPFPNA